MAVHFTRAMTFFQAACHAGKISCCSSCLYRGQDVQNISGRRHRGRRKGRFLLVVPTWHGELPSLAVLVTLHHLFECPPAQIPGPGKWTCHYGKISRMIGLCVCMCVSVCLCADSSKSANTPFLFAALCVRLLLINLPGTAALAFESHLGCKWNLKAKGVALW